MLWARDKTYNLQHFPLAAYAKHKIVILLLYLYPEKFAILKKIPPLTPPPKKKNFIAISTGNLKHQHIFAISSLGTSTF